MSQWTDIQPPYQVGISWDAKYAYLYVNGKQVGLSPLDHPIQVEKDAKLSIGSDYPVSRPVWVAGMSDVKVVDHALPPSELAAATDNTTNSTQ